MTDTYSTALTSGLPLALGGNTFGWTSDRDDSFAVLDAFSAAGGHHVDTADMYSQWVDGNSGGDSETILGQWFAQTGKRSEIFLATKVAALETRKGLAKDNVRAALADSLERLQTDYVDLYYAHYDDKTQSPEQLAETFGELVAEGTVRYIGLSNLVPERQQAWIDAAARLGFAKPAAQQPSYSLARRGYVEGTYGEVARRNGLAIFSYSSLASGMLTGKYRTVEDTKGAARSFAVEDRMSRDSGVHLVDTLVDVADRHSCAPATVALAWLLAKGVTAPIASARNVDQLQALLAAPGLALSEDDVAVLDAASEPFTVIEG